MGTESGPPKKRLRASLNGNVQLTECVREFNLPRQYPSMVRKLYKDTSTDKGARQTISMGVPCIPPKVALSSKIIQNNDISLTNTRTIRTIKLKAKDGRDLGEVNVQDLPQNIQGKTITIAKNDIKKVPEIIPVTDKTEGITIGVLTPINILKSNDAQHSQAEINLLSTLQPVKQQRDQVVEIPRDKNVTESTVLSNDLKKLSTNMDSQDRPQVQVFQSGKSWYMVKYPHASVTKIVNQSTKSLLIGKAPREVNCRNVTIPTISPIKDQLRQKATAPSKVQHGTDSTSLVVNNAPKVYNNSRMVVRKWSQPRTPDSTTDSCKSKPLPNAECEEPTTRPKIEISRVFGPSTNKPATPGQSRLSAETLKPVTRSDTLIQKSSNLRQDMIALPSDKQNNANASVISENEMAPTSNTEILKITGSSTSPETPVSTAQSTTGSGANSGSTGSSTGSSAWRRKLFANKNSDAFKYSSSRDLTSSRQMNKKFVVNGEKKDEITSHLSILEKALSTVEDEVLREKALKALAECGIGIERLVPKRPATEQKSVKDSDTQTSIFGLWEKEQFIYVPPEIPGVQRMRITERTTPEKPTNNIITNPSSRDLYINGMEMANWSSSACTELTNMVEGYVKGNDVATRVANIFAKPSPVRPEVIEQLEKDFDEHKKYDENGFLNIHKAVLADQIYAVHRYLLVLQACDESADIPTRNGHTSLELAIRYESSPKIVQMLLNAGAEPTSTDTGHDSALIIASKQSMSILMELIPHVKSRISLDNYDSTGFAALHYCTQNGYQKGAMALIRASADVNLRDRRSGRTPLFHAIENDHNDIAEMLLENGAEPSVPNYGGQTIFNVVDEVKHYNLLEVMHRSRK